MLEYERTASESALAVAVAMALTLWTAGGGRVVPPPHVIEILARGSRQPVQNGRTEGTGHHSPRGRGGRCWCGSRPIKAKNHNRDGSIHGFSLLRAKDRSRVPGWDFLLKPGMQEFMVNAPSEPGEYVVVCTVICSADHEGIAHAFCGCAVAASGGSRQFGDCAGGLGGRAPWEQNRKFRKERKRRHAGNHE